MILLVSTGFTYLRESFNTFVFAFAKVPFRDDFYWLKISRCTTRTHMSLTSLARNNALAALGCTLSDALALVQLNTMSSFSFPPAIPPLVQEMNTINPQT